ncbi:KCP-like protein [Mya arenaria]|uniref:KCP-like protein n=1 Tax=Mya arenaria TaxID=6604 RepID=A0ABY7DWZ5_MYAAR|nr:uncharacterized protein DDB_G0274171-like [Mya arenaria]WAR02255.1 KCP-like protein [Mya arenaria]
MQTVNIFFGLVLVITNCRETGATKLDCALVRCLLPDCNGDDTITPTGQCCPTCPGNQNKSQCVVGDNAFADGSIWVDKCNKCRCNDGQVLCTKTKCPDCTLQLCEPLPCDEKKQIKRPWECCPKCKPEKCNAQTNADKDPCTSCFCENDDLVCYTFACIACVGETKKGDCCPTCSSTP